MIEQRRNGSLRSDPTFSDPRDFTRENEGNKMRHNQPEMKKHTIYSSYLRAQQEIRDSIQPPKQSNSQTPSTQLKTRKFENDKEGF